MAPCAQNWTGKTLPDHKAERLDFVRQELAAIGIIPPDTSHLRITPVRPGDQDAPPRVHLILNLVATRISQRAQYTTARLAMDEGPPGDGGVSRETVAAQQISTTQPSVAA